MRSKRRSQSKKKTKEDAMAKNTVKKEENKKRSSRKINNKKDDDQNTKTIPSSLSITKQITQKKSQQKQKSQAKKQEKSYGKKKQQLRSISHRRKNSPQLSYNKSKKKQTPSKARQLHQDKSEKQSQDGDLMMDIEDIIEKQLEMQDKQYKRLHFGRKSEQSFRQKPSNEEIVKTIFFPKKHKNIEGKSTHQELIVEGIMRVDRDLRNRKHKNRNSNMKTLSRKVNMKIERLKNEVDREIMNGGIVPWLLPEWGLQKVEKNKSKDVREWMREGLGFNCEQESSKGEGRQQQPQQSEQQQNNKPPNPQQQNIYYERAIINQNFQQYYNTGIKFLYEHLPKRQITLSEFQSYEDFVKSNFTIVYYLSRFYYKNFDKTKRYFTDSAQFDKYYTQDLMDCFQYIFPQVKEIVENQWRQKFQQGWDEYDENIGVRAYEQRRIDKIRKDRSRMKQSKKDEKQQIEQQQAQNMITYKDWLSIFRKAFNPAHRQEANNLNNQQHQHHNQTSPLEPKQQSQLQQQQQLEMIESNNLITHSIGEKSHHFESPISKGMQQRIKLMQEHKGGQNQLQLQDSGVQQEDLDEYYQQISTIIKSKRKEYYNTSNTSSAQRPISRLGELYQQQQSMAMRQKQPQKGLLKQKKHKHKKTNKRLNKSMIELRSKANLHSDSDSDTEQDIQGIDEAFLLEDDQDNN